MCSYSSLGIAIHRADVILYATGNINSPTIRPMWSSKRTISSTIWHVEADESALTNNTNGSRINNVIYTSRTFQHFQFSWNCIRYRGVICFYNSNYILQLHLNVFGSKLFIYEAYQWANNIITRSACTFDLQNYFSWTPEIILNRSNEKLSNLYGGWKYKNNSANKSRKFLASQPLFKYFLS